MLVGDVSFHLKFALKVTHTPFKNADFYHYLLITSQLLELAKKFHLSQVGSRPPAFQQAIDEVHMLTPQRIAQKANLSFL